MHFEILERSQISTVPISEWDALAEKAIEKNPFYESWNLTPALELLDPKADIKIITVRINQQLAALFPIKVSGLLPYLKIISIWKHNHCFLTTPLISDELYSGADHAPALVWEAILSYLQNTLKASIFCANSHTAAISFQSLPFYTRRYYRPSVKTPKNWEQYERELPGKRKKEYRRICKRLTEQGHLVFLADVHQNLSDIMLKFIHLEASGWKGIHGDALDKRADEKEYYLRVIKNAEYYHKAFFNVLELNQTAIAISFGYRCQHEFYEIKTAYSEDYKRWYPGIVLELKNLANYSTHHYHEVDSCTDPDNFVISRMWPDKKLMMNSWVFKFRWLQRFFCSVYPRLRKLILRYQRSH